MRLLDGITDSMDRVWAGSGICWWTERPGMLQFMGSQKVVYYWATELNWTELNWLHSLWTYLTILSDSLVLLLHLLIRNKLPPYLAAQDNKHLLSHLFSEGKSSLGGWLLFKVFYEIAVKLLTGVVVIWRLDQGWKMCFQDILLMAVGRRLWFLAMWSSLEWLLMTW